MECRRGLRHQPIDRCKRSLASSRGDTCRLFHAMEVPDEGQDRPERVILVNVQGIEGTRAVIVRLTRRRGTDDHQIPCETDPQQRKTASTSPKAQDKESGHPLERARKRRVYLQAPVQRREEATRLNRLRKTLKKTDRKPPVGEKSDQGKGRYP